MEGKTRVLIEPVFDVGVLMCLVVIQDDMDVHPRGYGRLDKVEEFHKFLVTVSFRALTDHCAGGYIQRGEQRRGAMTFIIMRHGPSTPRGHR